MPAGSVWAAPVGTNPGADGWKLIGHTSEDGVTTTKPFTASESKLGFWFDESGEWRESDLRPYLDAVDRAVANMKKASESHSIKQPRRWMVGVEPPPPFKTFPFINNRSINERSKPMGLTKDHKYTDNDGDTVTVSAYNEDGHVSHIVAGKYGAYVSAADSIPVALNVLGYDRMEILGGFETTVGGHTTYGHVISTDDWRNRALAIAVANLKSIDRYDQRKAEREAAAEKRKAIEEPAAVAARAKVAEREIAERHFRKAKEAYNDAIIEAYEQEVSPEVAAKVQAALSAYETARRKVEGLPS